MAKNGLHIPPLFFLLVFLAALPASARQTTWYVLAHDDGCVDLKLLVKAEKCTRPKDSG
jgi:hypothetical protein